MSNHLLDLDFPIPDVVAGMKVPLVRSGDHLVAVVMVQRLLLLKHKQNMVRHHRNQNTIKLGYNEQTVT